MDNVQLHAHVDVAGVLDEELKRLEGEVREVEARLQRLETEAMRQMHGLRQQLKEQR